MPSAEADCNQGLKVELGRNTRGLCVDQNTLVLAGLDPAIQLSAPKLIDWSLDPRDKPGEDV